MARHSATPAPRRAGPRHLAEPSRSAGTPRVTPATQRRAAAMVAAALALVVVPSSVAAAASDEQLRQRQGQLESQRSAAQEELDATSASAAAARAALDEVTAAQPAAQAELESAEVALAEARARDAALASRLAAAQQEEVAAPEAITSGEEQIGVTRASLARIAAQAYRSGGIDSSLAVALEAESPQDFTDRYVMVDAATRSQSVALERLQEAKAVRTNQEARLSAVREEVASLKAQAEDNVAATAQAQDAAAARKAELDALETQRASALATLQEEEARYSQQVTAAQSESDGIGDTLRARAEQRAAEEAATAAAAAAEAARRQGSSAPPRSSPPSSGGTSSRAPSSIAPSSGILASPLAGGFRMTSPFGYRVHPVYHVRRLHAGTDMGAQCGTPVYAAADGQVVTATSISGYGNYLGIDHGTVAGRPVATGYAHLSRFAASPGQQVRRGQLVAYSGATGVGTACHLHFEVRINGTPVDALPWLR